MAYFKRKGAELEITQNAEDYQPGDVIAWNLGGSMTHIGVMTNRLSEDEERFLIVHNIGSGPKEEDVLFRYKIIGHYRYKKD